MLSLIICSRVPAMAAAVSQNVAATIGVPFEVIAVDNSSGRYGICEAYNIGAAQAQYELLCFLHEDLQFHTPGWGQLVAGILADTSIGVLGVAGGTYQVDAPAGWGGAGSPYHRQRVMHTAKGQAPVIDEWNVTPGQTVDAATLDGLWLCCRKQVWREFKFDQLAFPGFHFYDVDFCTRVFTKYRNCVTFSILIEHFSYGSFDVRWYANAVRYYRCRRALLPFGVAPLTASEAAKINLEALHLFTYSFIEHDINLKDAVFLVRECLARNPLDRASLGLAKKLLKLRLKRLWS